MNLPLGYRYAAAYAGIRKQQKDDIALIVPDTPAQAAAVFTQNVVQAAPVRLARKHIESSKGTVAAILINAGNANCATRTGDKVALASCKGVAKALKTRPQYVLPASDRGDWRGTREQALDRSDPRPGGRALAR